MLEQGFSYDNRFKYECSPAPCRWDQDPLPCYRQFRARAPFACTGTLYVPVVDSLCPINLSPPPSRHRLPCPDNQHDATLPCTPSDSEQNIMSC